MTESQHLCWFFVTDALKLVWSTWIIDVHTLKLVHTVNYSKALSTLKMRGIVLC